MRTAKAATLCAVALVALSGTVTASSDSDTLPLRPGDYVAPQFTVSLDTPATERWAPIVKSVLDRNGWDGSFGQVEHYIESLLPAWVLSMLEKPAEGLCNYMPGDFCDEVTGLSEAVVAMKPPQSNMTLGKIVAMQLIYDLSAACTSIVAQDQSGAVHHGRNLDYPIPGLRNLTAMITFTKGGKTLYNGTTFVGYIGLLTGQSPVFSVTVDERMIGEGNVLEMIIQAIMNIVSGIDGGSSIGFFLRQQLETQSGTFEEAVSTLNSTRLFAPVYLIVAGTQPGEGAVITRNRLGADVSHGADRGIWRIDPPAQYWRLETNYDNWNPPPSGDDRRDPANKAMSELGQGNVDGDHLFEVLSQPPVLNSGTKYTTLMCPATGEYRVIVRNYEG